MLPNKLFWQIALFSFIFLANVAAAKPVTLQVIEKDIEVDGKKSLVFDIVQPDGTFGYYGKKGETFDVTVENKTKVPLVLHWHGVIDPNDQDGVPFVTQLPIYPGKNYHYQFTLKQAGTYWLHSHYKLQEQRLMAAPLIIYDDANDKEKDVLMFIQDFTFTDPKIIYKKLREDQVVTNNSMKMSMDKTSEKNMNMDMSNMDMTKMDMKNSEMKMSMPTMDVSDVKFDAYLTNKHTLNNPDIKTVTPGETLRLRIINASASSNYYIDLGKLTGTLIAVDAESIKEMSGSRFQLAIGNRLDIRIKIPNDAKGVYPIFALPEGTKQRTGLILATTGATIPTLSSNTDASTPALDYSQELKLSAKEPMSQKPVARSLVYALDGDMKSYRWTINGEEWPYVTPYKIKPDERIELVFNNRSGMAHPMHFHGHVFQVSEINGQKVNGRKGDTVDVMPRTSMKVILESDNPGIWMLHCHVLYHQMGGMMTTINYEGVKDRFTLQQRVEGEKLYH